MSTTRSLVSDLVGATLAEALVRVDRGEEVTIERGDGRRLVLLPPGALDELDQVRDYRRRQAAWRQAEEIRQEVSARNRDLTPDQIEELADQLVRDAIDGLVQKGVVRFERDLPVRADDESPS